MQNASQIITLRVTRKTNTFLKIFTTHVASCPEKETIHYVMDNLVSALQGINPSGISILQDGSKTQWHDLSTEKPVK